MAVSEDRKFTKSFVFNLLEGIKNKTLGEIDKSGQFLRTIKSNKITGIAGDVIEQSVFGYSRDSKQECDIEINGILTELKTTGVRIPKKDFYKAKDKTGDAYNVYLNAKEGISITGVTFEPEIQLSFRDSHFWEKLEHLLIVFYEYNSYEVVPANAYKDFKVIDYCYNSFSEGEKEKLKKDWEIVRDYLLKIYSEFSETNIRNLKLEGFTHLLRPKLLLIELVPSFKRRKNGSGYQKPRYRLKQTFVNHIVRGHFNKSRELLELKLKDSFSSFEELDAKCHLLTEKFKGKTFEELKQEFNISSSVSIKDFASKCIVKMFGLEHGKLNEIVDFTQAGIIAKTITLTKKGLRTEDMKLQRINFGEWNDRDLDFEDSEVYRYFCEHSFLCPIFCEKNSNKPGLTTFEGFKRFAFDDDFINKDVKKTWLDSRSLVFHNELIWENKIFDGKPVVNKSGSISGAPNFPKSNAYTVFFRGGSNDSSEKYRTEEINGIIMLPQYFWLKGSFIADKLKSLPFL